LLALKIKKIVRIASRPFKATLGKKEIFLFLVNWNVAINAVMLFKYRK